MHARKAAAKYSFFDSKIIDVNEFKYPGHFALTEMFYNKSSQMTCIHDDLIQLTGMEAS